jgi:bifunctional non-homologous end joining protein LigD
VLLQGPITPMLATLGRAVPEGDGWALEPKWDGIRCVAHICPDGPRLFTRHGRAHHQRFPRLNADLAALPPGTVLDGELCCLEPLEGGRVRCRFDRISAFMVGREPHRPAAGLTATLVAFDLLAYRGDDIRGEPWAGRRAILEGLLRDADAALRLTPVFDATPAVHATLTADGWEGTVVKRRASRYVGRRSNSWVKVKSPR